AYWRNRHFVIVYKVKGDIVYVSDPSHGLIKYSKKEFIRAWQSSKEANQTDEGIVVLLEPTKEFYQTEHTDTTTGLKGAVPYLKSYKKYIFQVVLGLLVGGGIQLILPFLTQKLVDKGINLGDLNFVYILLIAQLTLF